MPDAPPYLAGHRQLLEPLQACQQPALVLYRFLDGATEQHRPTRWKNFALWANRHWAAEENVALCRALHSRQAEHAASYPGHQVLTRKTVSRLAVGLSYGKLWGNSFQLHPLYGLPYVPASALKGALSHSLVELGVDLPTRERLFGAAKHAGRLVLWDAFPVLPAHRQRLFAEDVINKHYPDYYEATTPEPPADYCSPDPVKFLTVAPKVEFRFHYAVRPGPDANLTPGEIRDWLSQCLSEFGVGAKTRGNYGRFR